MNPLTAADVLPDPATDAARTDLLRERAAAVLTVLDRTRPNWKAVAARILRDAPGCSWATLADIRAAINWAAGNPDPKKED